MTVLQNAKQNRTTRANIMKNGRISCLSKTHQLFSPKLIFMFWKLQINQLPVSIQEPLMHATMSRRGMRVMGKALNAQLSPSILLDTDWSRCRFDMYLDNKFMNANGIKAGIPLLQKIPITIIRLNIAYSSAAWSFQDVIYKFIFF